MYKKNNLGLHRLKGRDKHYKIVYIQHPKPVTFTVMTKKHNKALDTLYRKGLILEYITVGYNVIEACLSLLFGMIAQTIAKVTHSLQILKRL